MRKTLLLTVAALLLVSVDGWAQDFIRYYPPAGAAGLTSSGTAITSTLPILLPDGTAAAPSLAWANDTNTGFYASGGSDAIYWSTGGTPRGYFTAGVFAIGSDFAVIQMGASYDMRLRRDAANTLALQNGVNAQKFSLYETYTDASNYSRLGISATAGGTFKLTPEAAGTGTLRNVELGAGQFLLPDGTAAAPSLAFVNSTNMGMYRAGANQLAFSVLGFKFLQLDANGLKLIDNALSFSLGASSDVLLARDAANTLALRNGTTAQQFNLYETYTDASNYSRLSIQATAGAFKLLPAAAGTGTLRVVAIGDGGAKPTCEAATRGGIWYDAGGAGAADTLEVCRKDAGDAYAWVSLF